MGFADKKTAWIQRIGNPYTILRSSGNVSTYGRFAKGRQLLNPFDVNFVRFVNFPVNSGVQNGDIVQDETLNYQAFVTGAEDHPQFAENTVIYTELYIVNYPSIPAQRVMPPDYDDSGNPIVGTGGWTTILTAPMNVEHVNGNIPYKDGLLLANTVFKCIVQDTVDVQLLDRIVIDGKNYQISDVNRSISPGLQMVQVETDNRA